MKLVDRALEDGEQDELEVGFLERHGQAIVLLVAWTAMLGSLYFSEVRHFEPCRLCWFQRILMYPIAFIATVGILRADRGAPLYTLPLSLLGIAVSAYHTLLQRGFFSESTACLSGVPCSARYINWLGFISIPVLALVAFVLISLAGSAALRAPADDRPFRERAKVAGLIIATVLLFFAFMTLRA
jgi:disulfide bond formation protein DsbB